MLVYRQRQKVAIMNSNPLWSFYQNPKMQQFYQYANGTSDMVFMMNFSPRPIEWATIEGTPCSAELALMVALEADRRGEKVNVEFLPPTAKDESE